MNMMYVPI